MKNSIKKWYIALLGSLYLIGSMIGVLLVYINKGKFNYSVLLGALTGALILIIINLTVVLFKRSKQPK